MNIAEALVGAGLKPLDARVLLQHVLQASHAELIAHPERALRADEQASYRRLAERRRCGEPIAYLTGWREFYGRRYGVDPAVLIPRPETELLVDAALARLPVCGASILDLGTGSGNVAVTLALERPAAAVTATDLSAAALARARANAESLGARIELLAGNWYEPVAERRFDVIVSNPPYVAEGDAHLREGDLRFEPPASLAAGPDGMAAIRAIVAEARLHLEPAGWLIFEHGCEQAEASASILREAGFDACFLARDLAGLPRVSGGRSPAAWPE